MKEVTLKLSEVECITLESILMHSMNELEKVAEIDDLAKDEVQFIRKMEEKIRKARKSKSNEN